MCWTITTFLVNLLIGIAFWVASASVVPTMVSKIGNETNASGATLPIPVPAIAYLVYGIASFFTFLAVLALISFLLSCTGSERSKKSRHCGRYALWIFIAIIEAFTFIFLSLVFGFLILVLSLLNFIFSFLTPVIIAVAVPWAITLIFCITTSVVASKYKPEPSVEYEALSTVEN